MHNEGKYMQGEKTAFRIANEATDKLISKKIQETPEAQFHKNKRPNQKLDQRTKQTFVQRRRTDG